MSDNIYEYADSPTVYLKTLEVENRFWFRGDWRTEAGIYTVEKPWDEYYGLVVVGESREQVTPWSPSRPASKLDDGAWHGNVSVVKLEDKE